ncbi:MAG: oligosaccharide flippase family protein [Clostridiales bacterium]|nr:oligosaccharide flippase family protein [Clostridiales bacterium]
MGKENGESKVLKAGVGYTIGNYLLKGLSFLTVPVFSRLLSPADNGVFNTYLAYQTILFLLVGMALHTSLKNAKYKYEDGFAAYNSCCVLLIIINLLVWFMAGNLLYPLYGEMLGFSRTVVNLLLVDSFGTALILFFNTYVGLYYRYISFLKLSAFNAISNFGLSVLLILTVFKEDRATGRIFGNALPLAVISLVLIWYFWKQKRPSLNREYAGFALRYSLPMIPHGISQVVLSQFDRIMIKSMIGEWEAGIYSFAYTIFSIINVTANSLDNVWGPWFYEKMKEKDYDGIRRYSSKYAFGMLLFSILVMLGAPELVKILGTKDYYDAMYSVVPIVAGGYYMFLYLFPSYVEYYYEKTKYIALGTGLAAVINVVLNVVCIAKFGYLAAAYTTMATYLLYFSFHYMIAWRIRKGSLFDTGKLIQYILLAFVSSLVALALMEHWLIRWILIIGLGIYFLFWLEREFALRQKIRKKLGK